VSVLQSGATSGEPLDHPFQRKNLVIVEGVDDQALLVALIKHLSLAEFQVHEVGGKSNWYRKVRAIVLDDSFRDNVERVGFVRDADQSGRDSWSSCVNSIRSVGLAPPTHPNQLSEGDHKHCHTAVHIIPSVQSSGELEDLLMKTLKEDRLECVDGYFSCLQQKRIPSNYSSKQRVRVYFSGFPAPIRDTRVAIEAGYVDLNHSAMTEIRTFLTAVSGQ
jgi:hypothetical protein